MGDGLGGVIEFLKHIPIGNSVVTDGLPEVPSKGLHDGEEYASVGGLDGVALHEVERTVRIGLIVDVEAVEVHHLQQGPPGDISLLDAVDVSADRVALVDNV